MKRNTFESVLMRYMNVEPTIQNELSQKKKDKYHILMHIYRIQKNGTEEFIYRAAMETNKASGGDGIPVELFQILKDDAVKMLH